MRPGINGVWKEYEKSWVGIGGVWKEIEKMWDGINGVWKEVEGLGLSGLFSTYRSTSDYNSWAIRERNPTSLAVIGTQIITVDMNVYFASMPNRLFSSKRDKYSPKMQERNPLTFAIIREQTPIGSPPGGMSVWTIGTGIGGTLEDLYTSNNYGGSGYYAKWNPDNFTMPTSIRNLGEIGSGVYTPELLAGVGNSMFAFEVFEWYISRWLSRIDKSTASSLNSRRLGDEEELMDMAGSRDRLYVLHSSYHLQHIDTTTLSVITQVATAMGGSYPNIFNIFALK